MSNRPQRPCRHPLCPALTDDGWCDQHRAAGKRDQRENSAKRGYDRHWRKVRDQALIRDKYLCQMCLAQGRVTLATLVDHIIPVVVAPHLRLVLSNLQSLDVDCHAIKTAEDMKTYPQYATDMVANRF